MSLAKILYLKIRQMTDKEKAAREYAWNTLDKRCERIKCQELCKPYERKQDELHTRCRARYHCLRDGFLSGWDARQAEIDELKQSLSESFNTNVSLASKLSECKERLDEATRWIPCEERLPEESSCILALADIGEDRQAIYMGRREGDLYLTDNGLVLTSQPEIGYDGMILSWRPIDPERREG